MPLQASKTFLSAFAMWYLSDISTCVWSFSFRGFSPCPHLPLAGTYPCSAQRGALASTAPPPVDDRGQVFPGACLCLSSLHPTGEVVILRRLVGCVWRLSHCAAIWKLWLLNESQSHLCGAISLTTSFPVAVKLFSLAAVFVFIFQMCLFRCEVPFGLVCRSSLIHI